MTKRLYFVWYAMQQRCNNPRHKKYRIYGGRGITICEEWDSFDAFRDWALSSGYRPGLSIDRIDNDGNYCPANCRWTTNVEQCNNKRCNRLLTIGGETMTVAQWARRAGLGYTTVWTRLEKGRTPEECIKRGRLK